MLTLSPAYVRRLRLAGSPPGWRPNLPPVVLAVTPLTICGRMQSLQAPRTSDELATAIVHAEVNARLKRLRTGGPEASPHPSRAPVAEADLPSVARLQEEVMREPWVADVLAMVRRYPTRNVVSYAYVDDLLHPYSVSRFHFAVTRIPVPDPAFRAAGASAPPPARYAYMMRDLGSTNGVYVGDRKIAPNGAWFGPLQDGDVIRVAPKTKLAKQIDATPSDADVRVDNGLSKKDLHTEYVFRSHVDDAARAWWFLQHPPAPVAAAAAAAAAPRGGQKRPRDEPEEKDEGEEDEKVEETAELSREAAETLLREWTCSVCSDLMVDPVALDCGHGYCGACVAKWWDGKPGFEHTCPQCRRVHAGQAVPTRGAAETIRWLVRHCLTTEQRADYRKRERALTQAKKARK